MKISYKNEFVFNDGQLYQVLDRAEGARSDGISPGFVNFGVDRPTAIGRNKELSLEENQKMFFEQCENCYSCLDGDEKFCSLNSKVKIEEFSKLEQSNFLYKDKIKFLKIENIKIKRCEKGNTFDLIFRPSQGVDYSLENLDSEAMKKVLSLFGPIKDIFHLKGEVLQASLNGEGLIKGINIPTNDFRIKDIGLKMEELFNEPIKLVKNDGSVKNLVRNLKH